MCALEAVPPCKCGLAPLAFNCGFQESNNIVFVKYNREAARTFSGMCFPSPYDMPLLA